jgi:hypothetical protein
VVIVTAPITFFEASTDAGAGRLTITTPQRARVGMEMLAVIALATGRTLDVFDASWTQIGEADTDAGAVLLLRRDVTNEEPASFRFDADDQGEEDADPMVGAILLLRGLGNGDAMAAEGQAIAAAGDFIAVDVAASSYSDGVLSVFVPFANVSPAAPDGETAIATSAGDDRSLLISMQLPEAAGGVGDREIDADDAAGMTASFVVLAEQPAVAEALELIPKGTIGLVTEGV